MNIQLTDIVTIYEAEHQFLSTHKCQPFCTFNKIKLLIYDIIKIEMWVYFLIQNLILLNQPQQDHTQYINLQFLSVIFCKFAQFTELQFFNSITNCFLKQKKIYEIFTMIDEQFQNVEFAIQRMCLSIIRFIIDLLNIYQLIYSIKLLFKQLFLLLIPLIEEKPLGQELIIIMKEKLFQIRKIIINYLKLKPNYGQHYIIYLWILKVEGNMNQMILKRNYHLYKYKLEGKLLLQFSNYQKYVHQYAKIIIGVLLLKNKKKSIFKLMIQVQKQTLKEWLNFIQIQYLNVSLMDLNVKNVQRNLQREVIVANKFGVVAKIVKVVIGQAQNQLLDNHRNHNINIRGFQIIRQIIRSN